MNEWMDKIKASFSKIKRKELVIVFILIVLLVIVYFSGRGGLFSFASAESQTAAADGEYNYCERMTLDITEAVQLLTGSDGCKVIINWADGGEDIIAYTTTVNANGETNTPQIVTVNGVSGPIVLKEQFPKAVSVAVVCPANTSIATKLNIKYLISTLLQSDINDIAIYSC